jgi:hypothetical protein
MTGLRKMAATVFCILILSAVPSAGAEPPGRWSAEQARRWAEEHGWLVGCNFIPSTAINQLEMWQADSFDPATIDRELAWAESLGFNSLRVFLHHLLWQDDAKGFLERMEKFLAIAEKHRIGVMFVLFDSCWDPFPKLGKQREPKPHVHNSGWLQSPGAEVLKDPAKQNVLKPYVLGVVGHFHNDRRIHVWDVWNEPDNGDSAWQGDEKVRRVQPLLEKAFAWAREAKPAQPLTSAVWSGSWDDPEKLRPLERFQLDHSDVISFHDYQPLKELRSSVEGLRRYGRPILCTEYMARTEGSTFDPILGYLRKQNVGAYNWGFVSGKTQTIYPWDSWQKKYDDEPPLWFHDILRKDGTPYNPRETEYIRSITRPKK